MKNPLRLLIIMSCILSGSSIKVANAQKAGAIQFIAETHKTLGEIPKGAIELTKGTYNSIMLDKPVPYRVFSPKKPSWPGWDEINKQKHDQEGMRLVVYVLNLKGVSRPSSASDRTIIEDLIKDGFLVVTVDFGGAQFVDHLEFQKDINGLYLLFGGTQFFENYDEYIGSAQFLKGFRDYRLEFLEYPGIEKAGAFTSFKHPGNIPKEIPINRGAIYVVPSGYTVEANVVFKNNFKAKGWNNLSENVTSLFMDIIYPKPSSNTVKVPVILEGSTSLSENYITNPNSVVLYSWLFNGYAYAAMNYVYLLDPHFTAKRGLENLKDTTYTQNRAVRFLRSQKERFSLSGKVGATGISQSAIRCFLESNIDINESVLENELYGNESGKVDICMPNCGYYGNGEGSWNDIDEDTPPIVLTWNHYTGYGYIGHPLEAIWDAYLQSGYKDKILYINDLKAGQEYNVYHLNEIMSYFDKFCK